METFFGLTDSGINVLLLVGFTLSSILNVFLFMTDYMVNRLTEDGDTDESDAPFETVAEDTNKQAVTEELKDTTSDLLVKKTTRSEDMAFVMNRMSPLMTGNGILLSYRNGKLRIEVTPHREFNGFVDQLLKTCKEQFPTRVREVDPTTSHVLACMIDEPIAGLHHLLGLMTTFRLPGETITDQEIPPHTLAMLAVLMKFNASKAEYIRRGPFRLEDDLCNLVLDIGELKYGSAIAAEDNKASGDTSPSLPKVTLGAPLSNSGFPVPAGAFVKFKECHLDNIESRDTRESAKPIPSSFSTRGYKVDVKEDGLHVTLTGTIAWKLIELLSTLVDGVSIQQPSDPYSPATYIFSEEVKGLLEFLHLGTRGEFTELNWQEAVTAELVFFVTITKRTKKNRFKAYGTIEEVLAKLNQFVAEWLDEQDLSEPSPRPVVYEHKCLTEVDFQGKDYLISHQHGAMRVDINPENKGLVDAFTALSSSPLDFMRSGWDGTPPMERRVFFIVDACVQMQKFVTLFLKSGHVLKVEKVDTDKDYVQIAIGAQYPVVLMGIMRSVLAKAILKLEDVKSDDDIS